MENQGKTQQQIESANFGCVAALAGMVMVAVVWAVVILITTP